ncbi:hypothetical protein S7335_4783 [Synechococcus sp. PCC 7335]|uniref:helicase HerA domain-containing protein n=1 Tax=Synechococcus sp. (strain ATCC 29403 / PCC 7335) TaxID=91464 RepID=UPI00017ED95F|nr:DUF87 domain-containing protein [Synechococcus sp. PCC 7335]EDX87076.1 hypothetical protein S7335_4783 [Synechococcus sp. PCC 7335]
MTIEPRLTVFCSHQGLDTFHAITHQHHIWHSDPYDVDTIHQPARSAYERLLSRVDSGVADDSGRILLLLGESGAGKTHLMRVFRNQTHGRNQGFFSYMQMTSAVSNYARYVLRSTIDSFEKPYYENFGVTTGLMKISNALAESPSVMTKSELHLLRQENLNPSELLGLIYPVADRVIGLEKFSGVDLDVIRALLYLQSGQPAISAKVLKFLRCEPLAPYDSDMLGGMASRDHDDDPLRVLQSLALLVRAVTSGAFVICLDQLEDIRTMEFAEQRFQRAIQTIVTLAEIPNVVVVLSCLADFYESLKKQLPTPYVDRLELDPTPVTLKAQRTTDEVHLIIEKRLQHLYDAADIDISDIQNSLYPFPSGTVDKLASLPTRRVLDWCLQKREESISTGKPPELGPSLGPDPDPEFTELSQLWNDHSAGTFLPPESDHDLLRLLGNSIVQCAKELGDSYCFTVDKSGDYLTTDIQIGQNPIQESLLLGLCQKSSAGGALLRQIQAFESAASGYIPVILRTTEFPGNPRTQTAAKIGSFISNGGRRAMVVDSDWRKMIALQKFRELHGSRTDYQQWLQTERPLSQLPSIQEILKLRQLIVEIPNSPPTAIPAYPSPTRETSSTEPQPKRPASSSSYTINSSPPKPGSAILLGHTRTSVPTSVEIKPEALVRHGAFLGGSGSGKTTLALSLIEQLLLREIPAILLDRKGDLCSYADPTAWNKPNSDPQVAVSRQLLQDKIEVSVYTPGTIPGQGRPLSIAIAPPGLGQLPSGERQQIANYCATAIGGILNYKQYGQDKSRVAILGQAITVLSELQIDNPLSINRLIEFIAEEDPLLVNAIGVLDPKHCKKLAEDLQTLSLMRGHLFNSQSEQLSVDRLLTSPTSEKTPLSIINLGSLGDNDNILFWISQFLLDLNRYAQKHPSGKLQAVVLFDEADLYLPAQGKPSTKEPMESLLKRARSAGIGILLATQSPGDLDYKCRDQISSWFVGKVKENTALKKLKPMLSEAKIDVTSKLANQKVGEFFDIRAGNVTSLKANMSLVRAEQVPLEEIKKIAAQSQ